MHAMAADGTDQFREAATMGDAAMMDGLTLFGLFAVTAMLVFYALEERSPWYISRLRALALWAQSTDFCNSVTFRAFGAKCEMTLKRLNWSVVHPRLTEPANDIYNRRCFDFLTD